MFFYIAIILVIILIPCILIGLYYFSKQEYNNPFITMLLKPDKLQLLKSQKINKEIHKKIALILSIQTLVLIVLSVILLIQFRSYSTTMRYIIIILMFTVRIISNRLIEIIL